MLKYNQMLFKENSQNYQILKENSYYFKYLNRGTIDYKAFDAQMKEKYKKRTSDKIENILDNMDLVNSVLEVLK